MLLEWLSCFCRTLFTKIKGAFYSNVNLFLSLVKHPFFDAFILFLPCHNEKCSQQKPIHIHTLPARHIPKRADFTFFGWGNGSQVRKEEYSQSSRNLPNITISFLPFRVFDPVFRPTWVGLLLLIYQKTMWMETHVMCLCQKWQCMYMWRTRICLNSWTSPFPICVRKSLAFEYLPFCLLHKKIHYVWGDCSVLLGNRTSTIRWLQHAHLRSQREKAVRLACWRDLSEVLSSNKSRVIKSWQEEWSYNEKRQNLIKWWGAGSSAGNVPLKKF